MRPSLSRPTFLEFLSPVKPSCQCETTLFGDTKATQKRQTHESLDTRANSCIFESLHSKSVTGTRLSRNDVKVRRVGKKCMPLLLKTSKIGISSLSGPRHFVRTEHFRTFFSIFGGAWRQKMFISLGPTTFCGRGTLESTYFTAAEGRLSRRISPRPAVPSRT